MFVIAALTDGTSLLEADSENLKNKESDRIVEMQKILKQIGIKSNVKGNKIKIFGNSKIKYLNKKIKVPNLRDHRICMSTVILSLLTGANSNIKSFETVGTSSPNFLKIIRYLGGSFEIKKNK